MSTQEGGPSSAPPAEIKEEDAATAQPVTIDVLSSAPTATAPLPTAGLTKKDYEVMSRIVKYLTEYKDEEYVISQPPCS